VSIRGFDSVRPFQLPEPGSLRLPWAILFRAFSPFGLSLVTSAATAVIRVHSSSFVVRRFPPQSRNLFRPYRAWELLNHATQGAARRLALPWAILCRAFSPFGLSLVSSAATAVIRAGRPLMCGAEAKESSTPHPSPLLVRGGEGELFCSTINPGRRGLVWLALGYSLSGFQPCWSEPPYVGCYGCCGDWASSAVHPHAKGATDAKGGLS